MTFDITWRDGAYYVSVPNYRGGTVYTKEAVEGTVKALEEINSQAVCAVIATENECFRMLQNCAEISERALNLLRMQP